MSVTKLRCDWWAGSSAIVNERFGWFVLQLPAGGVLVRGELLLSLRSASATTVPHHATHANANANANANATVLTSSLQT